MTVSPFLVNLGGTDLGGYPNNSYRLVIFSTVADDPACQWNPGYMAWFPPAGPIDLQWQVWIDAGAGGSNAQFVAKVIKNASWDDYGNLLSGTDCQAGIGGLLSQPGTAVCGGSFSGTANAGDFYQLYLWASAAGDPPGTCTINGDQPHTWFSGKSFG